MLFTPNLRLLRRHPLSRALGFFAVSTGRLAVDIATGGAALPTLTGTLAPTYIPAGTALTFAGASANRLAWSTVSQNQWVNANDFTVSVLGVIVGNDFAPGSNSYPELLKFASSGSLVCVGFENVSGSVSANFLGDSLTANVGTVALGSTITNPGNSLGFAVPNRQALYTWRLTGTTLDFFIDGVLFDTFTVTAHSAAVAAAISTANAGAALSATGKIKAWYVHNRALQQAEISQLALNPWCVVQPLPTLLRRVQAAGGGGGINADASFTEQGDAISAAATLAIAAGASFTEAADAIASTAASAIAVAGAFTEAGDAVAGAATNAIVANGAVTEPDTVGSGATTAIVVNGGFTEQDDAVSSTATTGSAGINADASFTEESDVVTSAAAMALVASGAFTEQGDTVSSAASGLAAPDTSIPASLLPSMGAMSAPRTVSRVNHSTLDLHRVNIVRRNREVLAVINAFLETADEA